MSQCNEKVINLFGHVPSGGDVIEITMVDAPSAEAEKEEMSAKLVSKKSKEIERLRKNAWIH
jgi:hypothetical protein